VSLQLTDEQNAMVATIREFAARECGSREQRLALTNGGTSPLHDIAQRVDEHPGELMPREEQFRAAVVGTIAGGSKTLGLQ
jgi:hypothetical protein